MDDSSLLIMYNHVVLDICWYKTHFLLSFPPSPGKDVLVALLGTCCDASTRSRLQAHQNSYSQRQVSTSETSWTAFTKPAVWQLQTDVRMRSICRVG